MTDTSLIQAITRFHPRQGEWAVALRATLSAVVPLVVLFTTDHLDWALYAAFGAMSSLYGRNQALPGRLRMQLEAGASLLAAILIGVCVGISPARDWLAIPAVAIFATVLAIIVHRRNWHPGGVILQVFAVGGVSSSVRTVSDFVPAAAVTIATIAFVLLLTLVTSSIARLWQRRSSHEPAPRPAPSAGAPEWPLHHYVIRYALAIAVAGTIATAIGIGHPYWAMVSVTVPLAAADAKGRSLRGIQRVIGTLLGVLVTWAVLSFDPSPVVLIIVIGIAQAGAEMFVGRNYGFALLFITPLALCMVQLVHPIPVTQLIADRAIETVLGVAVGLAITLLTHERKQVGDTD
ncbi:FUSC family protein [uncultured Microbacterium sp.]|uniref:FUSC family protein n=1 Tax=uncultured Microbacterium sp. TaxID=191216 RepID=UPI002638CDEF|nr:FUSC family protein [uncultured Microbacterium sp.]